MADNQYDVLKLKVKEEKFVTQYMVDGNATQSVLRAKLSTTYEGARVMGSDFMKNSRVLAEINRRTREYRTAANISRDENVKRMQAIAEADIRNYYHMVERPYTIETTGDDGKPVIKKGTEKVYELKPFDELTEAQSYAIASIKPGRYGIELTLRDGQKSVDMLNRHDGFYEKDNAQLGAAAGTAVGMLLPDNNRTKKASE